MKGQHLVTNYISQKDIAIRVSNGVNQSAVVGNYFRDEEAVQCVDTVDVSAAAKLGLAHSTWAESKRVLDDLRLIFALGSDPEKRGLKKRKRATRAMWAIDGAAPQVTFDQLPDPWPFVPCEAIR